jgi:hypothetical protein
MKTAAEVLAWFKARKEALAPSRTWPVFVESYQVGSELGATIEALEPLVETDEDARDEVCVCGVPGCPEGP